MSQEVPFTSYEQKVRSEIHSWQNARTGFLTRLLRAGGSVIKPLVSHVLRRIPPPIRETVADAVMGALEALKDASYWTYRDSDIVKAAQREGAMAEDISGLAEVELETLDRTARRFFRSNQLVATLEGAGCGLGGWWLIAADVPILFTVAFRVVQQIGACYGFDMRDPQMVHVVLRVFNAGTAAKPEIKAAALFDMHVAGIAMARKWTYDRTAKRTATGVLVKSLKEATKHLPRQISRFVTQRKLAQAIPVVGAAVGGFFNYWFVASVARSAYMLFRELYLARKYRAYQPQDWATDVQDAVFQDLGHSSPNAGI